MTSNFRAYAEFFDCVELRAAFIALYNSQTVRDECKTTVSWLFALKQFNSDSSGGDRGTQDSGYSTTSKIFFYTEKNQNV